MHRIVDFRASELLKLQMNFKKALDPAGVEFRLLTLAWTDQFLPFIELKVAKRARKQEHSQTAGIWLLTLS